MKKIILSLLFCAASAASVFAGEEDWDKSLGFGMGASFFKSGFEYESDSGKKLDGEIKGFTYDFANVEVRLANKNNNFSFLAGFSAGLLFPTLNLDGECVSDKLDDPFGLRFGLELGFGYRFVCSENFPSRRASSWGRSSCGRASVIQATATRALASRPANSILDLTCSWITA